MRRPQNFQRGTSSQSVPKRFRYAELGFPACVSTKGVLRAEGRSTGAHVRAHRLSQSDHPRHLQMDHDILQAHISESIEEQTVDMHVPHILSFASPSSSSSRLTFAACAAHFAKSSSHIELRGLVVLVHPGLAVLIQSCATVPQH